MGRVAPVKSDAAWSPSNTMRPQSRMSTTSTSRSSGTGTPASAPCGAWGRGAPSAASPAPARAAAASSRSSSKAWATAMAALRWPEPTEACMTMTRGLGGAAASSPAGSAVSDNAGAAAGVSAASEGLAFPTGPEGGSSASPGRSIRGCGRAALSVSMLPSYRNVPACGRFPGPPAPGFTERVEPFRKRGARWLRIRDGRRTGRCAPGRRVNWSPAVLRRTGTRKARPCAGSAISRLCSGRLGTRARSDTRGPPWHPAPTSAASLRSALRCLKIHPCIAALALQ